MLLPVVVALSSVVVDDEEVIFLVTVDELEFLTVRPELALAVTLVLMLALALVETEIDELFEIVKEDANGITVELAKIKAVTPTLRSLVRLDVEDGKRRNCCLRLC